MCVSVTPLAFRFLPPRAIGRLRTTYLPDPRTLAGHLSEAWDHLERLLADDQAFDHLGLAFTHCAFAAELDASGSPDVAMGSDTYGGFPVVGLRYVMDGLFAPAAIAATTYPDFIGTALEALVRVELGELDDHPLAAACAALACAVQCQDPAFRFGFA